MDAKLKTVLAVVAGAAFGAAAVQGLQGLHAQAKPKGTHFAAHWEEEPSSKGPRAGNVRSEFKRPKSNVTNPNKAPAPTGASGRKR